MFNLQENFHPLFSQFLKKYIFFQKNLIFGKKKLLLNKFHKL